MKTNEELNALKEEVETLNKKLAELTEEELEQVTGGRFGYRKDKDKKGSRITAGFTPIAAAGKGKGKGVARATAIDDVE